MSADLHLHTSFSDGTYSPEELVSHAQRHGLSTIAVTDHDTVEACARVATACGLAGLEFVPGTEITAELHGQELHLLGYFIDSENPRLLAELGRFQSIRQDRIREMVGRLNKLNIPIDAESVFALANCRSPGRPHIGRVLVQAGYCSSLDEAFERFLKRNRPAWVPKAKIGAVGAIRLIHDAGGLASLAHPGLNHIDALIPELAEAGMDALECFHSKHTSAVTQYYLGVTRQLRLLITGGSDCHGMNKGKPLIGSVKLACDYVEALKDRVEKMRTARPAVASAPEPSVH